MTVAKPIDVADRLRKVLSPDEVTHIQVLLDDVESIVRGRYPALAGLDIEAVKRVECWVIIRYLRNPEAKVSETVSAEYSFTRRDDTARGELELLDSDWAALEPISMESTSGAFEIVLGPG